MGAGGPFKNKMLLVGFFQSMGASSFFFCSEVSPPPPPHPSVRMYTFSHTINRTASRGM